MTSKRIILTVLLLALFSASQDLSAQKGYVPAPENIQARQEFQDAKLGIFIHWGIYSMLGEGEWVMHKHRYDWREYAKLAGGFYPSGFNAEEWVRAFKESGAKYLTITSRHHDGFSMFRTAQSDYNIVDATPYGRDVMAELAKACAAEGMKFGFYYSHLDWYRADYPVGSSSSAIPRGDRSKNDYASYLNFMKGQLTELLTQYGPVHTIWFDGYWDHTGKSASDPYRDTFDWKLDEQYALIHSLQPGCLVGNNHHTNVHEGEDIQIFERDLPGENKFGYSGGSSISALPLETCGTMSNAWGYNIADQKDFKSWEDMVRMLVGAAGRNANLLLNIGPRPDGRLPEVAVQRLKEMGAWMKVYGETIYGTRGGFIGPHDWGVTTQKDNRLFVHILKLQDDVLYLPTGTRKVKSAKVFKDGTPVRFSKADGGIVLSVPTPGKDVDYVVELTISQ